MTLLTLLIKTAEMIKTATFDTFDENRLKTRRLCSQDETLFRGAIVLRRVLTSPRGVLTF